MQAMEIPGYTIERELGKGGMATVYLAIQDRLARQVALKVMNPAMDTDNNFTERFIKEGRIIDQLRHPQIIPLFEFNYYKHYYYFSMEFMPGGTLHQQIQQGLTPERAVTITKLIAEALAYAHQRGVIHRDLKPQNILFRQDGTPVLSDFGIAKVMDADATNLTALGMVIGSLQYMSPEQALGDTLDPRSDLYSLGVMFYEMLTGRIPYQAGDIYSLSLMQNSRPIPELPPELGRLQPILDKLLTRNRNSRFESAERLIQAIEPIDGGQFFRPSSRNAAPIIASALPKPETRADAPVRATWRLVLGGSLLAVATGIAVGGYFAVFHPSSRPGPETGIGPAQPSRDAASPPPNEIQRQQARELLAQARARQQHGAFDDSLDLTEQGLRLVPGQPDLLALRDQVKIQADNQNRIAGLLRDCATRFPLDRLTEAQGEAAMICYGPILKLDPANVEARASLDRIFNQYAEWANSALLRGDPTTAEDYLARLSLLKPDHPRLPSLRQNLRAKRDQQRREEEAARRQATTETKPPREEEPARRTAAETKRKPAMAETGINKNRRCGDILSRITLGEPVSNEDRAFITKECR